MIPSCQTETAALLSHLTGAQPLETHVSALFLGSKEVFKLRKAIRLPFHDFTSLAERERTARREVELNAPHAPGMYLGIAAVVRSTDGALRLGGVGEAVDWVVRMARVPPDAFLDVLAAQGGLSPVLLEGVADAVASMHATAPRDENVDAAAAQYHVLLGNERSAIAAGLPVRRVTAWREAAETEWRRCEPWLRARAARGFVRRVHGDLHLGNLCLWRGSPVAFDALEFDEAMGTTDTAYDLAFLLMDLEHGLPDDEGLTAANLVFNRYVARTGDTSLVAGLPLFLSQRALVRAHVEAARGNAADSQRYLDSAIGYLAPLQPVVVAVGGLQGTGKSTLARSLGPWLGPSPGALVLRSDEIRKRRFGVAPTERLPDEAYTPGVSAAVFAELFEAAGEAAAMGHAVIADAMFLGRADRGRIRTAAGAVPFMGFWLSAPLAALEARIAARGPDASDATIEVLRRTAVGGAEAAEWRPIAAMSKEEAFAAAYEAVHTRFPNAVRARRCHPGGGSR